MLRVGNTIRIPENELVESFVQAAGPGGQHVNKTASAVQLRFNVANSPSLPLAVARRLQQLAGSRINQAGELMIEARRFRSQQRNRADARQRLAQLIEQAAQPPAKRKPTRVPRSTKRRRLTAKKRRGDTKTRRKPPRIDD